MKEFIVTATITWAIVGAVSVLRGWPWLAAMCLIAVFAGLFTLLVLGGKE